MLNELFERYPALQICEKDIEDAIKEMVVALLTVNILSENL